MSIKKQFASGFFWTAISTIGTQSISFIISIILARILLPQEFGLIAILSIFMGVGEVLVNGGLSVSLIRSLSVTEEDFSIVFFFNLFSAILIYFLAFAFSNAIATFYDQPILEQIVKVYSLIFIIDAFGMIQTTKLIKDLDFKKQMRVSLPSVFISGIVGISAAFFGCGVWSLVYLALSRSLVYTIYIWYISTWVPKIMWNYSIFKLHIKFGYKLLFSGILDNIFTNIYSIIIGKQYSISQVGFYQRADSLKQLPVSIISATITKISFTILAKVQNDEVKFKHIYSKFMITIVFLISPFLFSLAALGTPLFRFLLSEKWLPAVPFFQILCFIGVLYMIHSYNLSVLNIKGRSDLYFKLEFIKKILTVIVIFISINFGIYGLLFGNLFLAIISLFINTYYSGRFIQYTTLEQFKDVAPFILFGIGIGCIVYLSDFLFFNSFDDLTRLIFGFSLAFLIFIGISHIAKLTPYQDIKSLIKEYKT